MIKALLIGGSNYPPGQNALWRVRGDLEKMQAVLETAIADSVAPGSSTEARVSSLIDRPRQETKAAIKEFFAGLTDSDSAIFVFSGYGLRQQDGQLHFVVCPQAETIPESLLDDPDNFISASSVQQAMDDSPAQHQVVILDCNFRQTFAESAEVPEASVALGEQLGGDRRVILTSSIAVQPIGEPEALRVNQSDDEGVWSYLRYLAEGIETGTADQNGDNRISAAELHRYAKQKLTVAAPANEAQLLDQSADAANAPIFSISESERAVHYHQMLELHRADSNEVDEAGEKFLTGRAALKSLQEAFELAPEKAEVIEREVLRPVREFRRRQQVYRQRFAELTQMQQIPISDHIRQELAQLQRSLYLTAGDVAVLSALPQAQHQKRQRAREQDNLSRYEQVYLAALQRQNPLTENDRQILHSLKQVLQLKDEDIEALGQRLSAQPESVDTVLPPTPQSVFVDRPSDRPKSSTQSANQPASQTAAPKANVANEAAEKTPLSDSSSTQTGVQAKTVLQESTGATGATENNPSDNVAANKSSPGEKPDPVDGKPDLVDNKSELATKRQQRNAVLGIVGLLILSVPILVALATYFYDPKNPFPFNLFNKPIDQAAAQKFNEWGQAKAQDGYNAKAIEDYSKAIELNPNDPASYVNRGLAYHHVGKLDNAIKDYDTAIALDPKLAKAYSNRSHVYYDKKDFPRALDDASRATRDDPTLAEAYLNLGNAQLASGDASSPIDNYNRAINLNPEKSLLAAAYTNRGNVVARNDVNAAFKDYGKAIETNPEFAEAFYNRGLGYEKIGDRTAAIRDYEKASGLYLKQGYIPQQQDTLKRIKFLKETTPLPPTQVPNRANQLR